MWHDQTPEKTDRLDKKGHPCSQGNVMWPFVGGRKFSSCSVGYLQDGIGVMESAAHYNTQNARFIHDRLQHLKKSAQTPDPKPKTAATPAPPPVKRCAGDTRVEPEEYTLDGFTSIYANAQIAVPLNGKYQWKGCVVRGSSFYNTENRVTLKFAPANQALQRGSWMMSDAYGHIGQLRNEHITVVKGMYLLYKYGGGYTWGMAPPKATIIESSKAGQDLDVPDLGHCVKCACTSQGKVWLRDSKRRPELNGDYVYYTCSKKKTVVYKKQGSAKAVFLHYSNHGWELTPSVSKDNGYAYCPLEDLRNCGREQWRVELDGSTGDEDDISYEKEYAFFCVARALVMILFFVNTKGHHTCPVILKINLASQIGIRTGQIDSVSILVDA